MTSNLESPIDTTNEAQGVTYVPFPSAQSVAEMYRNEVVITTVFAVKEGCQDRFDRSQHIELKEFVSAIISEERKSYLDRQQRSVYFHMLKSFYDRNIPDFLNLRRFEYGDDAENWTKDVKLSDCVFVKFKRGKSVGCQHYIRGCLVECNVCKKLYPCRFCHDEVECHEFPRFETQNVKCIYCDLTQPFQQSCSNPNCQQQFGSYFCNICKMICGLGEDAKPNHHCSGCDICMVGYQEFSQHCYQCGGCFNAKFFAKHLCVKKTGNCPVCLESIAKTMFSITTLPCSHLLHFHCMDGMLQKGRYQCPLCKKYMLKDEQCERVTANYSELVTSVFVPVYLENIVNKHRCCDCGKTVFQFSSLPGFCPDCRIFNTEVVEQNVDENLYYEYLEGNKDKNIPLPFMSNLESLEKFLLQKSGFNNMTHVYDALNTKQFLEMEVGTICALFYETICYNWEQVLEVLTKYIVQRRRC